MKKTAVEWLQEQLVKGNMKPIEAIKQAKEMEKEQMILIYKAAFQDGFNGELFEFEKYYNETFKSE
jgi:precorrin-4 methylase